MIINTISIKESYDILLEEFKEYQIIHIEDWNGDYEGVLLKSNRNQTIRSRLAKKTPKKAGYFTAFWRKDLGGKNEAYSLEDSPDYLSIVVKDDNNSGIFVFPKNIAASEGIISSKGKIGKMGMRFYPPWCDKLNRTAKKTQMWQCRYFKDYSK